MESIKHLFITSQFLHSMHDNACSYFLLLLPIEYPRLSAVSTRLMIDTNPSIVNICLNSFPKNFFNIYNLFTLCYTKCGFTF